MSRVDHPDHYNQHPSGVECIRVVEWFNFNLGNAIKYIWRADTTDQALVDLRKAEWDIGTVDIYRLPRVLENAGLTRKHRQAILVAQRIGLCRFLETVFVNHGYGVKIFTEREHAISWLEGASP